MSQKNNTFLIIAAGAGAILLAGSHKRKRRIRHKDGLSVDINPVIHVEDMDEDDSFNIKNEPDPEPESEDINNENVLNSIDISYSAASVISRNMDPENVAQLGMLYQIKYDDDPIEVCCEALFGSRRPMNESMLSAAKDLLIRIDCGPWNQALYGVTLNLFDKNHDIYFTRKGVSFDPIYQDNLRRILNGLRPTSSPGDSYALIWIPMINQDKFDEGIITTEGMNYQDTEYGLGGSMIDPPEEILDLEFDEVSSNEVGCALPEGDFRRTLVSN